MKVEMKVNISIESCGCSWSEIKPEGKTDGVPWYELGHCDEESQVWIKVCRLHARYGFHREIDGFDEGISK